jgi:hypothetical protein
MSCYTPDCACLRHMYTVVRQGRAGQGVVASSLSTLLGLGLGRLHPHGAATGSCGTGLRRSVKLEVGRTSHGRQAAQWKPAGQVNSQCRAVLSFGHTWLLWKCDPWSTEAVVGGCELKQAVLQPASRRSTCARACFPLSLCSSYTGWSLCSPCYKHRHNKSLCKHSTTDIVQR